jgi:hypothetical protein
MNLKDLATQPTVHLPNGRALTQASEHNEHTIFVNQKSIQPHETENGTHTIELAIAPSFKFIEPAKDLVQITRLVQEFGEVHSVSVKLNSNQHIYFESMHSVYGRKANGKPIKLTYIKTHLNTK